MENKIILVTGATSQVGIVLVKELIARGYGVRCLVRRTSSIDGIRGQGVEFLYGDLDSFEDVRAAAEGADKIIHIAGIWRIEHLLRAAEEIDFKGRIIFIGSMSRFKKLDSIDEKEKELAGRMAGAEKMISESKLDYVILRPTMLYGIDRDKNILQIIRFMRKFRFYPLIGGGNAQKHPVYVGDVAKAVVSCMSGTEVSRRDYVIAGEKPIKHREMLAAIKRNLPFKAFILRVPVFAGYAAVFLYKLVKPSSYINYAMVKRVNEDSSYDIGPATRDFGYAPADFETGVKKQIDHLIENGLI